MEFGEQRGAKQFSSGFIVTFAQSARHFESRLAIAVAGSFAHGKQGIGDLGHGTDHNYGTICEPPLNDVRHAVNCFCILYGGPAEFHHNHGRGISMTNVEKTNAENLPLRH